MFVYDTSRDRTVFKVISSTRVTFHTDPLDSRLDRYFAKQSQLHTADGQTFELSSNLWHHRWPSTSEEGLTRPWKKIVECTRNICQNNRKVPLITFVAIYSKTFGTVEDIAVWNFRHRWFMWRHFRQWWKNFRFGSALFTQFWRCKCGFVYYSKRSKNIQGWQN